MAGPTRAARTTVPSAPDRRRLRSIISARASAMPLARPAHPQSGTFSTAACNAEMALKDRSAGRRTTASARTLIVIRWRSTRGSREGPRSATAGRLVPATASTSRISVAAERSGQPATGSRPNADHTGSEVRARASVARRRICSSCDRNSASRGKSPLRTCRCRTAIRCLASSRRDLASSPRTTTQAVIATSTTRAVATPAASRRYRARRPR